MPSVTKKYRDFDLNFEPHPVSGDITTLKDADAVKQSVKNLILTGTFERPQRPKVGSGVSNLLFEPITPVSQQQIKIAIEDTIRRFEPRVELISVEVTTLPDENGYRATITFAVTAASEIVSVEVFLERVR